MLLLLKVKTVMQKTREIVFEQMVALGPRCSSQSSGPSTRPPAARHRPRSSIAQQLPRKVFVTTHAAELSMTIDDIRVKLRAVCGRGRRVICLLELSSKWAAWRMVAHPLERCKTHTVALLLAAISATKQLRKVQGL